MAKLKNVEWAGRPLTLPIVGDVTFDKEGYLEVSDEDHSAIMELNEAMGFPFGKPAEKKVPEITDEKGNDVTTEAVSIEEVKEDAIEESLDDTDAIDTSSSEDAIEEQVSIDNASDEKKPSLTEQLSEVKMEELKALAIDSKLPEAEWKGMKKKSDLVEYLVSKLEE